MEYPSLDNPTAGATRFNTDTSQLEIYDGNQWTGALSNLETNCARAVFAGGHFPSPYSASDVIEYVQINTTGNSLDFGDISVARDWCTGTGSNGTRGIWVGGAGSPQNVTIDFVTIQTTGNAADFGDCSEARGSCGGLANRIRGVYGGGEVGGNPKRNSMEYVTIASKGNAIDFGDILQATASLLGTCATQTRGIFAGGYTPTALNVMQYITIMTTGNAIDFGDLTDLSNELAAGFSNATRGIFAGGSTDNDKINYITVASTGNAAMFGTLSEGGGQSCMGGGCTHTRGVIGAASSPNNNNSISYITISQLGDSKDFGDLSFNRGCGGCNSNAHGGL